jgi:hypothetical protein
MDNVENQVEEAQDAKPSLRESIGRSLAAQNIDTEPQTPTIIEDSKEAVALDESLETLEPQEAPALQESVSPVETPAVERIPLVPPADMNKLEKDAFLNPTIDNAHILQQYMNRRAYETRTDYQRKMQEVEDLRKKTSSVYDTIKEYEDDYARKGINIGDITKRSIAWDKAMQSSPVETALEWLDSYGLTLEDLKNRSIPQNAAAAQVPTNYLTREQAEKIAEDKARALFEQQQEEQKQSAVAYFNERVVQSFMTAKPLFRDPETASQLEAEMAPIVSALSSTGKYSSPEEILETAYNYVVAGNPTFSSLQSAMTARPMVEQKQAVAQKAKAASKTISGSAGSGTPRSEIRNLRDNLRRRFGGE